MTDNDLIQCKPGCIYEGTAGGLRICNYIFDVGHSRPCPAGPDFTEWTPRDKTRKPQSITISGKRGRRRKWDTALARKLYDEGASQSQIAKACGTTPPAVALWQKEEKPGAQRNQKRKTEGAEKGTEAGGISGIGCASRS